MSLPLTLQPSPPSTQPHSSPIPSPRAQMRTRTVVAANNQTEVAVMTPFRSSGRTEWPPKILLEQPQSAGQPPPGCGRSGLPLRPRPHAVVAAITPSRDPSPGASAVAAESDRPESPSLLSLPRMSAAEMIAQNAMASPTLKHRDAAHEPNNMQLRTPNQRAPTNDAQSALTLTPSQSSHERSSSGTLIPPASPMLAQGQWIYTLGPSASPESSPTYPPDNVGLRDTSMRALELGPAHTPNHASPIQVTLSGWPTQSPMTDTPNFTRVTPAVDPAPSTVLDAAAGTSAAAAPVPPILVSPTWQESHAHQLDLEFGSAGASVAASSTPASPIEAHPTVSSYLSLLLTPDLPPAAIVLLRDQSGCLGATDDDANLLICLSTLHLSGRRFADFESLALEVRRVHAESFRNKQALATFLAGNKHALGIAKLLDAAEAEKSGGISGAGASTSAPPISPRDLHALYAHSGAGPFCVRILQEEVRQRALGAPRSSAPDLHSWGELVDQVRERMGRWSLVRARETEMILALLTDLRGGASALLLPASPLAPSPLGSHALSRADAFQLVEAVAMHRASVSGAGATAAAPAAAGAFATPMAGLLLLSLLRELASEDAAFEDVAELQQALLLTLARKSNSDACAALRARLLASGTATGQSAPDTTSPAAFDAWLVSMRRQGFSVPFLAALANLQPWVGGVAAKSGPGHSALEQFASFCLDASTRYESNAETAAICLIQQYLATCAPRPLVAPSASAASMLLGSQRATPLLLYLECVAVLHEHNHGASDGGDGGGRESPPAIAEPRPLFPDVEALQTEVDAMRGRHQAELHHAVQGLTSAGLAASQSQEVLASILPRFASSIRGALTAATTVPPHPTPLRLFLAQLRQCKTGTPLTPSAVETAAAAFLVEWREAQSMLHSLLMTLPISSLSSPLTPPSLLHSQLLVREWQLEQLQCESNSAVACLRTLLHMQRAAASTHPRQVAGDWTTFLNLFRSARQHALSSDPDAPELQHLTVPQQLLHAFLSARHARLLSPTLAHGGTAADVELLTCMQTSSTGSPRAFYHGNTTALPYAAAFHFLLQLQTLEFERAHLCDSWPQLQEMVQSARTESAHKEIDLLTHLAAPDCLLFAPAPNADAAAASATTNPAIPSGSFQPSLSNVARFSQYVGCGLMKLSVFRALGLEQGSMCARAGQQTYDRFVDFLRRSRAIVAAEDAVTVLTGVGEAKSAAAVSAVAPPVVPLAAVWDPLPLQPAPRNENEALCVD